jgi:hypothetical protein
MIRFLAGAVAAMAAVSFTVAFAARLASVREEQPRMPVLQAPAGAPSSPVVSGPARLRSVAALPALHVPRPTPTPAAPTLVVAPESPPVAPSGGEPAELPAAPAPLAPVPAPPAREQSQEPPQRGPTFDSSG